MVHAMLSEDDEDTRGFVRRHKALVVLLVIVLLILAVLGGGAFYLNRQIDSIPRVALKVKGERPAAPTNHSMNILLAGADNGAAGGNTIAKEVADGHWVSGSHRSDTIMVLHLTADRKHAYLISIPRDTYVTVSGYGKQKINAAFSYGGPSLYVQTIEQFSQLRMQHLAIIDWNGFRDLATALGGVQVYVPDDSYDSANDIHWHKGEQTLTGNKALLYVRQRHGLANGDFDRIARQQNFLRSALSQAADKGNLTNPIRFKNMLSAITHNLTIDSAFSNSDVRSLAWSLRHLRAKDITFVTCPMERFADEQVGSVIIPDLKQTRELFSDVATDDLDAYVTKYGVNARTLNAANNVS
ncbi:LytR family transcriptional regulator [Nocardioides mangrovicus]|uniref:LytR family transcriptional regulator n=1 Tax=Nocardioides mangrovicus TaxID=2478913 RepID=A0A3L8NWM1_9ACTN|nr:LCP family protein [Nocardioides mangrovicus]RLV47646.1 LytR family transcriptional regulator [Nocardioides mangrovicus]